jgi:hypothetical protein
VSGWSSPVGWAFGSEYGSEDATAENASGGDTAENASGDATVENASGDATVENTSGDATVENASGDATVENASGATGDAPPGDLSRNASAPIAERVDPGVRAIGADRVHERGVTGEGVRVGVVDAGFDRDSRAIAGRVAGVRRFDGALTPERRTHGTAVAEIVTETAPNATLYLASVGDTPTPERYRLAIEWLIANDVAVIVDAGSYFPRTIDDADRITAAAERATAEGVVFVTSAGNYANRHWTGNGTEEGWVEFAPEEEVNFLNEGNRTNGSVSLRLRWNSTADYDLYLYRYLRGADPVVAKSVHRHDQNETRRSEAIDVAVPGGQYYAAVYAHNGTEDPGRLSLFAPHHPLEFSVAAGSVVAPATSDRVIVVTAVDATGRAYNFSSRGTATAEVDLGAPGSANLSVSRTFVGSSAAAPYVAGTVALMSGANASLTPGRVESVLERTARSDGRLDAFAAVRNASTGSGAPGNWTVEERATTVTATNATTVTATNATTVTATNTTATATNATVS